MPTELFDGVAEPSEAYGYAELQAAYDQRKATPTNVTLEIAGSYDANSGNMQVELSAESTTPLPAGDYRLHIVLAASGIYFEAPNGIDWHEYTMRDMISDHSGHSVDFVGDMPQRASVVVDFTLDPLFVPENCELVCFLQDHDDREVWQAAKAQVTQLDATGVAESASAFALGAAYPNPFNPVTRIPVTLEKSSNVRLEIIDPAGRVLRVLQDGVLAAGDREFIWNGRDAADRPLPSGVYLARLSTEIGTSSRRLVLLK